MEEQNDEPIIPPKELPPTPLEIVAGPSAETDNSRKYTSLALKIEIERKCLEGAENMISQLTDLRALDNAREELNESQRVYIIFYKK
jgi:nicotinate-nucleotide pyrophosphorylase